MLSSSGGLVGVIFGYAGLGAIRQLIPESVGLTRLQMTHLDAGGWCFALGASILIGLLLGVTPAMFLSKIGSARVGRSFVSRQPIVGIVLWFLLVGFEVGGLLDGTAASWNLPDQRTGYGIYRIYYSIAPCSRSRVTVLLSLAPPNRSAYPKGVHSTISPGRS